MFKNNFTQAELDFKKFHDLANDNPILHPLSHIVLISVAIKKKDKHLALEHTWLAICAPLASVRNIFVQIQQ